MCQLMLPLGSDPVRTVISAANTVAAAAAAALDLPVADTRFPGAAAEAEETLHTVWETARAEIGRHPDMNADDYYLIDALCRRASGGRRIGEDPRRPCAADALSGDRADTPYARPAPSGAGRFFTSSGRVRRPKVGKGWFRAGFSATGRRSCPTTVSPSPRRRSPR